MIAELKQIIAKQSAQIQEQNAQIKGLMNRIEQLVSKSGQGAANGQAETAVVTEGPRKMPRRRSPPPTVSNTPCQQKQEAMEADEASASEGNTQPPAEGKQQLTHGETVILTALGRIEDRLNTLEAKHGRLASRVTTLEIRIKSASQKRDRIGRLKEAIAKRRGRLETLTEHDTEPKHQEQ